MTLHPLAPTDFRLLWDWMQDDPDCNLDDDSPVTVEGFCKILESRLDAGEIVTGIYEGGEPIGAIGYAPSTPDRGWLHGICFSPEAQGTGKAHVAFQHFLELREAEGVRLINAAFYVTNQRVSRFLSKSGFVPTDVRYGPVTQHGQPVDVQVMAYTPQE